MGDLAAVAGVGVGGAGDVGASCLLDSCEGEEVSDVASAVEHAAAMKLSGRIAKPALSGGIGIFFSQYHSPATGMGRFAYDFCTFPLHQGQLCWHGQLWWQCHLWQQGRLWRGGWLWQQVRVCMTVVLAVLAWLAVVTSLAVAEGPVVTAGLAELGEMEKV